MQGRRAATCFGPVCGFVHECARTRGEWAAQVGLCTQEAAVPVGALTGVTPCLRTRPRLSNLPSAPRQRTARPIFHPAAEHRLFS